MIAPAASLPPKGLRRGLIEEEGRFEIDVVLKIPVGLGDFVHACAAHENGRGADEDVEAAKRADDGFDQFRVAGDRAQIGGQRQMRAAFHLGDHCFHLVFGQIDHRDPGARRAESQRHFSSDAAGPAGDEDALAFEA